MSARFRKSSNNPGPAPTGAGDVDSLGSADRLMVQSLARGLRVMEAFAEADAPLSLAEIASLAGIDRSAAQRLTHTLRAAGWLIPGEGGHGLRPGRAVLCRAYDALRLDPLLQRASPVLLGLRREVRERVDLSLIDGQRMVYALRMQSKRENFFATLVGHTVPLAQTSGGWACLACLPEGEADALIAGADLPAITQRTLTDPGAIRAEVAEARKRGHALALEQIQIGEIALGVALRDGAGRPLGAIHVAGSLSEWQPEDFRARIAPLAAEAARAIEMGGTGL